ncbi:MAG: metallophosphoesterase [Paludibacteraceae bacterium]|nr:metallophosphoesterase [Paludibacteraceae bacterium]
MKRSLYISFIILATITFASCDRIDVAGIFNGSSPHHDARFKQSMEYNETFGINESGLQTIHATENTYEIYWATDVHVAGTTVLLDSFINLALTDYYCEAIVFGGDIIDAKNNYPLFYKSLEPAVASGMPLFCTPGNHDLCFGQWKEYVEYWKTSVYWFQVIIPSGEKDLFICIDSADATLGRAQFNWLKDLLEKKSKEGYRHIIVFSHTHMFKKDSNNANGAHFNTEEIYDITSLLSKYHVEYYMNGHDHTPEVTIYKNVHYVTIGSMKDDYKERAAYAVMTMFGKHIDVSLYRMDGEDYWFDDESDYYDEE